jgi:hypothetical protein
MSYSSVLYTRCQHTLLSNQLRTSSSPAPYARNTLRINGLGEYGKAHSCKILILLDLQAWLLGLDSIRNPPVNRSAGGFL